MKRPAPPHPYFAGTLSLGQVAHRWGISGREVRQLLARQRLGFVMIETRLRIPLEEVERFETDHRDGQR